MHTTTEPAYVEQLRALGACAAALAWTQAYPTWPQAWDACSEPDWLIWAAERSGAWTARAEADYQRSKAPAFADYRRIEAPADAEYQRIKALAQADYQRIEAPAYAEYQRIEALAWAEYLRTSCATIRSLIPCPTLPRHA